MAVLSTIRKLFHNDAYDASDPVLPAPTAEYSIRPLTPDDLAEVLTLNIRCFRNGDNYTKHTFEFLLSDARTLGYKMVADGSEMVGFAFIMENPNGAAHLTTIGVSPEHRRRGIAARMLQHVEMKARSRGLYTVVLEVRAGNLAAQDLYRRAGYSIVQRISKYYFNGEDGFLMMKGLN
ncbi:MAG: ribosomal protein S18-alanine N-acetyltransferase [Chloracidobacterium sp.]|nr:ribosomal protein S18-alanine N-acetyltransferase [Chloracidobacterium sp.]MCO5334220.1 ribosomal protein S18-alanine N-acetyltransferase [Pyrinomonadaceae bacterium]